MLPMTDTTSRSVAYQARPAAPDRVSVASPLMSRSMEAKLRLSS